MVVVESLFGPLPEVPCVNAHQVLFRDQGVPDYEFFVDALSGQSVSRAAFHARVVDLATGLLAPVRSGGLHFAPRKDIVGILAPNSIDYITLVHALLLATCPLTLFSFYSTEHELVYLFKRSQATRVFVHSSLLRRAKAAADKAGFPRERIYLLDDGRDVSRPSVTRPSVDSLVRNAIDRKLPKAAVQPVQKDTVAYMIFSSGTSGTPKAVMVSHTNMIASFLTAGMFAAELQRSLAREGLAPHKGSLAAVASGPPNAGIVTALAVLPFYHTYGMHQYVLRTMLVPQRTVILPRFDVNQVFDMIPRYRIELMAMVPSMVHQFLSSPRLQSTDLSSLQAVSCGGAYLPPSLSKQLQSRLNSKILMPEGYGLSEVTIAALGRPPIAFFDGKLPVNPLSTGVLLPGVTARIVRSVKHAPPKAGEKVGDVIEVEEAAVNEPGELWLRGPLIAIGYLGDKQATRETFLPDGWMRTGDRFRVDEHGHFFFEDRVKDTLKIGGAQVSPAEIEICIMETPEGIVKDVTVIGVQPPKASSRLGRDEKWPRAYVVLSDKGRALGEEKAAIMINKWVQQSLSKYKRLRGGIAFIDQIPKSPTGKTLRRLLLDQYDAEQKTGPEGKTKAKL